MIQPPSEVHLAYTVRVASAQQGFEVSVRATGLKGRQASFQLPGWTPGWYVFRGNEENLSGFSAKGPEGRPLTIQQTEKRTWQVELSGAPEVTFSYRVRASDTGLGFFEPYLDERHGFVPGPAALVYVVDQKEVPCSIDYEVPDGWQVASANAPVAGKPHAFTAPNYDTLIDQPAELGYFSRQERTIQGVPVSIVMVGADGADTTRWVNQVFKIAEAGIRVLGGPPFPRYTFFFHFSRKDGFIGGLEHLNGTVIRLSPSVLRQVDAENLALVAHEFVHAWNVKRARPAALGPFDYTKQVRVKDLWFCEGVTDYYAPRLLVEAGIATQRFWLGYHTEQLNTLMDNPARHEITLEEASRQVWESEAESQGAGGLSYYNKGLVVGLLLDIELRRRTDNKVGLDDLLKALVAQAQKTGKGFADGEIERLASSLSRTDFAPFFTRALRSVEELPLRETLEAGGIQVEETSTKTPTLGIVWDFAQSRSGQLRVKGVLEKGPAAAAGIRTGDIVVRFNGASVEALFGGALAQKAPGEQVRLTLRRNNVLETTDLTLGTETSYSYRLLPLPRPTALQAGILAAISTPR